MTTQEFIAFCKHQHDVECNQKYDKAKPYSFHLDKVHGISRDYISVIPKEQHGLIEMAIYGHDLIEDARVSYNDIGALAGYDVAEIVFLCTEDKGRSRGERKSPLFYETLSSNDLAVFVKLCDIAANSEYSLRSGSSMFKKYKEEWPKVKSILYTEKYKEIFDDLDFLYTR